MPGAAFTTGSFDIGGNLGSPVAPYADKRPFAFGGKIAEIVL
jgi:hypothetical protein